MKALYIHTDDVHNMTAPREVVPIIMDLVKPQSVLDVGCGTGTWLKAFEEAGVFNYIGVDGDYVDKTQLKISIDRFVAKDFRHSWSINQKFDLVLSLEVAEHLPEESADCFVETLVNHANDTIIFSAAIPGQGGQNHLNEQWPEYWQKKFESHGYYFHDVIRSRIWNNNQVEWWYKQNIFLVSRDPFSQTIMNLVHPECFKQRIQEGSNLLNSVLDGSVGVRQSMGVFLKSLKYRFFK